MFRSIDDNAPSFKEWNDSNDKLLVINGIINDDGDSNEDRLNDDVPSEDPPSLSEFLHLSKPTDALLDSTLSKQRPILDYFKYVSV
ncbi:unnamed protein product [Rotaria socialis]|uniref:Uncharacterized protein n=1 Tax=Rotaria socialis TaxID=392032 RepID=A0A821TS96_9BILA|nr:unnamed protein product [Rotaria socialis]